jgi:hypothetical protein
MPQEEGDDVRLYRSLIGGATTAASACRGMRDRDAAGAAGPPPLTVPARRA